MSKQNSSTGERHNLENDDLQRPLSIADLVSLYGTACVYDASEWMGLQASISSTKADPYNSAKHHQPLLRPSYQAPFRLIPFRQVRGSSAVLPVLERAAIGRARLARRFHSVLAFGLLLCLLAKFSYGILGAGTRQAPSFADLNDLTSDRVPPIGPMAEGPKSHAPMLIPRIIHQTYTTKRLPAKITSEISDSWKLHNGGAWEHRFYDDNACLELVRTEFPQYLDAYLKLPCNVERSDFFRYMVILKHGGVYADVDVECRKPLDSVLRPEDTMVVGWEREEATREQATRSGYVRQRQVLQWFFAAAPGHPVLKQICDSIAANVDTVFSSNPYRDTLERTGPGTWTDKVLQYALQHPPSKKAQHGQQQWSVRILPKVAFGIGPDDHRAMPVTSPEVVIVHHFLGSWKGWWKGVLRCRNAACVRNWAVNKISRLQSLWPTLSQQSIGEHPSQEHYPVSVDFEPPFTMMVNLISHGDTQSGSDVSAAISDWGSWQAGARPHAHKPSVVDLLVRSLGQPGSGAVLVDVGAAQGFFSLAAAARGHRVVSFEASQASVASLQSSIGYNGMEDLVDLRSVPLGAQRERVCLQRRGDAGRADAADVDLRRGYGHPSVHAVPPAECAQITQRETLSSVLSEDPSMAGRVGALRISASGWEGWILEGAMQWLQYHPPKLILIEFSAELLRQAGYKDPTKLLEQLLSLGYTDIAHAGSVCNARWLNLTRDVPLQGEVVLEGGPYQDDQVARGEAVYGQLQQPAWCRLRPDSFHLLEGQGRTPENLLFIHNTYHTSTRGAQGLAAMHQ